MANRPLELLDLDSSLGTNVMSMAPSRLFIICGGREVLKIVDIGDTLQVAKSLRAGGRLNLNYSVQDLEWHFRDEQYVLSAAKNSSIILWNLERHETSKIQETYKAHNQIVNRVRWNPLNPACFLSAGQDGKLMLWDRNTPEPVLVMEGRADGARDVQFAHGNENVFASSFDNGSVQTWDVRNPRSPVLRIAAHQRNALSIDWHPEFHHLLMSGGSDKQIKVWNTDSPQVPVFKVQAPEPLSRVKWRPGSIYQLCSVSHSHDNNLYIWHLAEPFLPQLVFRGHSSLVTDFLWQDDRLLTCSQNGYLIRHRLDDACRPGTYARSQAIAISSSNQIVAFADNPLDCNPDITLAKLDKLLIDSRQSDRPNKGQTVSKQLPDPTSSLRYFAENYALKGNSLVSICKQNAQVAKNHDRKDLQRLWLSIADLVGEQEGESEGDWLQEILSSTMLDIIDYYAESGDLQTAAVLCKVLKIDRDRILGDYMDLLLSLGLYTPAAQLNLKQEDMDLFFRCHCGKELEDAQCGACGKPATCAVCQKQARGVVSWCQGCSHGGHSLHMAQWFKKYKCCPTGCGHECLV